MLSKFKKQGKLVRVDTLFIILGSVYVLVALVVNLTKVIRDPFKGDLGVYLHAARQLLAGANIYTKPTEDGLYYIYPPLIAALFTPLTFLPANVAAVIWFMFNVFLVAWVIKVSCELLTGTSFRVLPTKTKWMLGFFPVLFTVRFLLIHLYRGQTNILEMALVILALKMINESQKKSVIAGGVIGISIIIKIITFPIVILFLLERKLRVVGGIVIGSIISLLIPGLVIGHAENVSYLRFWFQSYVLDSAIRESRLGLGYNISPYGQLLRFFSPAVAFEHNSHPYYLTIFQASPGTILIADWLIRFAVVGSMVFYWFRNRKNKQILWGGGTALTFALIPVFVPTAQNSYLVMLLPSYVLVVYAWHCLQLRDKCFRSLVIGSFILTAMTGKDICGKLLEDVFTASGCMLWGTFLLILAIFRAASILRVQENLQIPPVTHCRDQPIGSE